jgi:RHS repeat-associated protein
VHTKGPVVQSEEYYPFGLTFNGYQRENSVGQKYLFNNKEIQKDLGFDLYDYGARFYESALGRFPSVDPQVETYNQWSPYLYGANNPIRYEDKNGEGPGDKVLGFAAALVDNAFGGFTNARSLASNYVNESGAADFNMGQDMGDVASMAVGAMMVEGGTGAAVGGVTVSATGVGAVVGAPTALGGIAMAAEGTILAGTGAANLASRKGRLNAEGINKPAETKPAETTNTPSLKDQANQIKAQNGGKNSVTLRTVDKQIRYDLAGKSHGSVPTPHKQIYKKNIVNGEVKSITRAFKEAQSMTQQELRAIRKYIESLPKK